MHIPAINQAEVSVGKEEGRILSIFEKEGVIKLKPGIDKVTARISDIVELVKVLHSKEIQDWIRTKYKGAVIPVNN